MTKTLRFKIVDTLYLLGILLPFLAVMALKVCFYPPSEGINVTGALVFFTLPLPFGGLPVSEAQINSLAVVIAVFFLCLYLTVE